MSQGAQITLDNLNDWLKKETSGIVEPLRSKGTDLLKEIQERRSDALVGSQKMLESSERELEKNNPKTHRFARNANKFAKNLTQSIEALRIPDLVNHDSLQDLMIDLGRTAGMMDQLRREAYPYITPYFIFDRRRLDVLLKRLADMYPKLQNFVTNNYAKARTAEEVSNSVDRLAETLKQEKQTKNELEQVLKEEEQLQEKLHATEQAIQEIQSRPELNELLATEETIKELRDKVKHNLRYLQKPFFKLRSLARNGDVAIPVDEMKKLEDYLSDPFEALATEPEGYPTLKNILRKLEEALNRNKLKLKSTRLRKAQEQIADLLNKDSLNKLHQNCAEARSRKNKMLTSNTVVSFQNRLIHLQAELREVQKEYEFATSRSNALETENKKLQEKTENLRRELEKTVLELTKKNIQVVLTQAK